MSLILTAAVVAFVSRQDPATIEPRLMRYPCVHGDTVVFQYADNLWVSSLSGGIARRLTSQVSSRAHISSDGRTVAFSAGYDGLANIYTMSIDGGEPTRLTYDVEPDICQGWTPDGKIAYTSTAGNFLNRQQRLWLISPNGGMPQKTPINEASEVSFFDDGRSIAYNRFPSAGFNWRHYRGGTEGRISFYNLDTNQYSEIPSHREQSYYPMVVGQMVYYISDRAGGVLNLYRYDTRNRRDEQLTKFTDDDIRTPSTDGKTIVFERSGLLNAYDISTGRITRPPIRVLSENLGSRPALRSLGTQILDFSLSPSGLRLSVEARGRVFSVPAKDGDTRELTNDTKVRERHPRWSPDGKSIAFDSDLSGNDNVYVRPELGGPATELTGFTASMVSDLIWSPDSKSIIVMRDDNSASVVDVASKKVTKVADAPFGFTAPESCIDWSPDSKWIAYTANVRNGHGALYLYELATGKATTVDPGFYDDSAVAFDKTGKYLYLISSRSFAISTLAQAATGTPMADTKAKLYVMPLASDTNDPMMVSSDEEGSAEGPAKPSPVTRIDLKGLADRMVPLTLPEDSYTFLTGTRNGVFFKSDAGLRKYDLDSREATPVMAPGAVVMKFNANRTKLAYLVPGMVGVVDLHPGPPAAIGQGRVNVSGVESVINFHDEWRQIFWEAWRFERDHYFDFKMHGLDWKAVGDHYARYLDYVNSRSDLNYVLAQMIGELGTSHAYVSGGDVNAPRPTSAIGYLGADFEAANGKIRFAKIYRGHNFDDTARGPLAEPGVTVNQGDYLLEINGEPVTDANPLSLLIGQANRYVTLKVNSTPSLTGARTVRVKAIANEGELRYWDFVDGNLALVDKLSNGRIGYVHVRDTGATGAMDLARGFFGQSQKDALLVDERWNGGGNLPTGFVELLARHNQAGVFGRHQGEQTDATAIDGPKAMLINGYAGSGGDMFPWLFRQEKVGPLVGKRTWGGLVGYDAPDVFIDGGTLTSPDAAIFNLKTGEIVAENQGIDPDIDVDLAPDLVTKGQDPQIEAAVKYLMAELAKWPAKRPWPEPPVRGKNGIIHP